MARTSNDIIFNDTVNNETVEGEAVDLTSIFGYSVQVVATGTTMNADVKLQSSNDNVNWVDVPSTSNNITGSSPVTLMINVADPFYKYVRVCVVEDAGSNINVVARINCKGV